MPERDYYAQKNPLERLHADSTAGIFQRLGVTPGPEMLRDVVRWDAFLTETASAMIRQAHPDLLLLHLAQTDYCHHQFGREAAEVKAAVARADAHIGTLRRALAEAGPADRWVMIVTGDHGFEEVRRGLHLNVLLARAGLRGCPEPGENWRATAYIASGSAAILVNPPDDAAAAAMAEAALRSEAGDAYTVVTRADLDALGALPNAAFAIAAAPDTRWDSRQAHRCSADRHAASAHRHALGGGACAAGNSPVITLLHWRPLTVSLCGTQRWSGTGQERR